MTMAVSKAETALSKRLWSLLIAWAKAGASDSPSRIAIKAEESMTMTGSAERTCLVVVQNVFRAATIEIGQCAATPGNLQDDC